jgi:hypothetical protein
MFTPSTFLGLLPSEGRVRVQIAGAELASLATGTDAKWSGIVTGIQTENGKDQFGRTYGENFALTVSLSAFADGLPPDSERVSIMYPTDKEFKEYRISGSRRRGNTMLTITLGPL